MKKKKLGGKIRAITQAHLDSSLVALILNLDRKRKEEMCRDLMRDYLEKQEGA